MYQGKYLIEVASHIGARNLNFYLDAYETMYALQTQELDPLYASPDPSRFAAMQTLVFEQGLEEKPREAIDALVRVHGQNGGLKDVGAFILAGLRQGKFTKQAPMRSELPFVFLNYSVAEDLFLRGQGRWYGLVESFLHDIKRPEAVEALQRYETMDLIVKGYTTIDMAAIFLGYSFVSRRDPHTLVRFPVNRRGFVEQIFHDVHQLFPMLNHA